MIIIIKKAKSFFHRVFYLSVRDNDKCKHLIEAAPMPTVRTLHRENLFNNYNTKFITIYYRRGSV